MGRWARRAAAVGGVGLVVVGLLVWGGVGWLGGVEDGVAAGGAGAGWMGELDDGLLLSELSVPGAHQAAAVWESWPGTARCQSLSVRRQLEIGVRYLDLRCRHRGDAFEMSHGMVSQRQEFGDVLEAVIGFLEVEPGECVIVVIKEEHRGEGNTRAFEDTFDSYVAGTEGRWWLGDRVPRLGEVRGKIVLVRRFAAARAPKGIATGGWGHRGITGGGVLRVQDEFVVGDVDEKWGLVKGLMDEAREEEAAVLFLNHVSGYRPGVFGLPDVPVVAREMNGKLKRELRGMGVGRVGVVVMDFVDEELSGLVWGRNGVGADADERLPSQTGW